MPMPYPGEFRENVVAVARQGEGGIAQIAKDFAIAESCLRNWLSAADAEDGKRGGPRAQEHRLADVAGRRGSAQAPRSLSVRL
jgi:transposase-like protein